MKVEGFFSFSNNVDIELSLDPYFQVISFTRGYISYPVRKSDIDFAIFANQSAGKFQISSLQSDGEDIGFYNLSAPTFNTSNLEGLGLGIWFDEPTQTLKIYREIFGQVPLFYVFKPNKFLAFSTSLASLIKIKGVRENLTPDVSTILEYAQFGADSVNYYSEHTFYDEVKTALPGHITTFDPTHVNSQLCIGFNTSKWQSLTSYHEFGEAFSFLFQKSIGSLLKDEMNPIASHLSGGLDSSSISAVSKHLFPEKTLHTLYAFTDTKHSDETYYAKLVAAKIGSIHHQVAPDVNYIESLLLYTSLYGHPERMVLAGTFQGTMMSFAKHLGAETLLIGHAGDSIVGSGFSVIHEAFMNRNWVLINQLLAQRAVNVRYHPDFSDWLSFSNKKKYDLISRYYLFRELPDMYKQLNFKRFLSLVKDLHDNTSLSIRSFVAEISKALIKKTLSSSVDYLTLAKDDLLLMKHRQQTPSFAKNSSWASGIHTSQAIGFNEEAFVLGNHHGLRNRFPFYSKELYELSLSVPEVTKFDMGRGRGHLREAMKGILPEEVRNRTDKAKFGIYNNIAVLKFYRQSLDFLEPANEVWNYLDRRKFLAAVKSIEGSKQKEGTSAVLVLRAISLSVWLYLFKNNGFG